MAKNRFDNIISIFNQKIFRIPDYQRGYAWRSDGNKEVEAFWNDLMNLSDGQSHFTGSLTLQEVPEDEKQRVLGDDAWMVDFQSFTPWFVVDGQQRLTTIIIFIQCLYEFLKDNDTIEKFMGLNKEVTLREMCNKYLYIANDEILIKSYIFGYDKNDTSNNFLKNKIFGDNSVTSNEESYYTLNMENAKSFFKKRIDALYDEGGKESIQRLYKKVTQQLQFDLIEVAQGNDFNIFVAFETINNRGKQLSNLEKLKNRLIYLTTYCDKGIKGNVEIVRKKINQGWSEIYRQLGRNTKISKGKISVLSDDEFLKTHWILYYQYSRKTGNDYINYLLDKKFTVQNVLEKQASSSSTEEILEDKDEEDSDPLEIQVDSRNENDDKKIGLEEIHDYVINLKNTARPWYYTYFPQDASEGELNQDIKNMMDRINRVGIAYFRPS